MFIYTYSASNILRLSHDLESVRVFYLGLSPFAVKPMFWFSLLANEITGNFISSSGCGPDWPNSRFRVMKFGRDVTVDAGGNYVKFHELNVRIEIKNK